MTTETTNTEQNNTDSVPSDVGVNTNPGHWTSYLENDLKGHFVGTDVNEFARNYMDLVDKTRTPITLDGYTHEGEEDVSMLREMAQKAGLTNLQFQTIKNEIQAAEKIALENRNENIKKERTEIAAGLQKEWGKEFENNMRSAKKVLDAIGDPELTKAILAPGKDGRSIGDNPNVIKLLHAISSSIREDVLKGGSPPNAGPKTVNGMKVFNYKT